MNDFEKRLEKATNKPGHSQTELKILGGEFTAFKAKMTAELCALHEEVARLELRVDSIDAASRSHLLLLHGVKEETTEDTRSLATAVLTGLGCPDEAIKGVECRRLGRPKSNKNRPVILTFQRLADRRYVWERKKGLKGSSLLLTESLTIIRQQLFTSARKAFTNKCWTSDGTVVVMLPDGNKRAIYTQKQLDAAVVLINKPPKTSIFSSSSSGTDLQPDDSRTIGLRSRANTKK